MARQPPARLAVHAGVATIELDRPERLNAFNRALYSELRELLARAAEDPDVRVVVVRGAGRAFSAGADLRARAEDPAARDVGATLRRYANPLILELRRIAKPVVAVVNGPAVGIGCSVALACDLVVAAEPAYLMLAFANIGLGPDGGASLLTAARAGLGRAAHMGLLAGRVGAHQAERWGLVDVVAPEGGLDAEVARVVETLVAGTPGSYAAVKEALNGWLLGPLERQLELEAWLQDERAQSAEHEAAVTAFLGR